MRSATPPEMIAGTAAAKVARKKNLTSTIPWGPYPIAANQRRSTDEKAKTISNVVADDKIGGRRNGEVDQNFDQRIDLILCGARCPPQGTRTRRALQRRGLRRSERKKGHHRPRDCPFRSPRFRRSWLKTKRFGCRRFYSAVGVCRNRLHGVLLPASPGATVYVYGVIDRSPPAHVDNHSRGAKIIFHAGEGLAKCAKSADGAGGSVRGSGLRDHDRACEKRNAGIPRAIR